MARTTHAYKIYMVLMWMLSEPIKFVHGNGLEVKPDPELANILYKVKGAFKIGDYLGQFFCYFYSNSNHIHSALDKIFVQWVLYPAKFDFNAKIQNFIVYFNLNFKPDFQKFKAEIPFSPSYVEPCSHIIQVRAFGEMVLLSIEATVKTVLPPFWRALL